MRVKVISAVSRLSVFNLRNRRNLRTVIQPTAARPNRGSALTRLDHLRRFRRLLTFRQKKLGFLARAFKKLADRGPDSPLETPAGQIALSPTVRPVRAVRDPFQR